MSYHESALLRESVDALNIKPDGIYADATFGGGGHSREILRRLKDGKLYAFDQDEDALKNTIEDPRLIMISSNFRYIKNFLKLYKALPLDGILADLGISSYQIDTPERGFSTRHEGPLDMRMDKRKNFTAKDIINRYDTEKLADVFYQYGEIKNATRLAQTIASKRKEKEIETTIELKAIATPCAIKGKENKYFAQLFQALRIEVNGELDALREFLEQGAEILVKGGRLVVISYHSLEDKLVKNFFRSGNFRGEVNKDFFGNPILPLQPVNRKSIVPGEEEILRNIRSRSARLRVAEKL
jgi:16S rRNA (cytosine1402-N4)-methyltransferase